MEITKLRAILYVMGIRILPYWNKYVYLHKELLQGDTDLAYFIYGDLVRVETQANVSAQWQSVNRKIGQRFALHGN